MGYTKCGSITDLDWVTAFRVLSWDGAQWSVVLEKCGLPRLRDGEIRWFGLKRLRTSGLIVEARQAGIDLGWTGLSTVSGSFLLDGISPPQPALERDRPLTATGVRLTGCPRGVEVRHALGEVRYRTRFLEIGFRLQRTGFTHLALDDEGRGRTGNNLLQRLQRPFLKGSDWWPSKEMNDLRDHFAQGLRLHPVGRPRLAGFHEHAARGSVSVRGNVVQYDIEFPAAGQWYRLRWEVLEDRLLLRAEREAAKPLRTWTSGVWHMSLDSTVTPCATIGRIIRRGEAGLAELPLLFHAPGQGTLSVRSDNENVLWRSDGWRAAFGNDPDPDMARLTYTTTAEIKLGERPQPQGDCLLLAGHHRAELDFAVVQHRVTGLRPRTPPIVRRALDRCALSALTYRPDTATLSNNSTSIHAILCADCWSAVATRLGRLLPNLAATDLLRDTLERHLAGGPSYGGGRIVKDGQVRYLEDEYIMSGAALLLALGDYLQATQDTLWLSRYRKPIRAELRRMRARDLDGDGLAESAHRLGIRGQHQWSTNWYDIISFGWKDAFANALLYPALRKLCAYFPDEDLGTWADRLRAAYVPTFLNPKTGWLAGWKCQRGKLHDHAFLFVNGAAVCGGLIDDEIARRMIGRLWNEMQRQKPPDYRLGLPGNLWTIPYADCKSRMKRGEFENGGLTHAQARHFVGALYRVGMTREADSVLEPMLSSLAGGTAFGGCGTGVEWRQWDGAATGYEGLTTDQFGILAVAIDRWRSRLATPRRPNKRKSSNA